MKKLSMEYIAGLFDGEGSIYIYEPNSRKNKFQLRLEIGMSDKDVIKLLKETVGGRIRTAQKKKQYRKMYIWDLTGEPLTDFLIKIQPYVVVKATQIKAGIKMRFLQEEYKNKLSGYMLTEEELVERLELKRIIKNSNYGRHNETV